MIPKTDREFLRSIDIAEAFAASLLGKTRQAVSSGLAEPKYFRDSDLATIVNYCRVNKPQLLADIEQYIEDSRGPQSAREVVSSHGMFLDSESILSAGEIWAILPDFRFFKSSHPAQARMLCERASRDLSTFTIVTSDPRDASLFWTECPVGTPAARDASTQTVEAVDALPYSILVEPQTRPQGWALVSGGYQKLDPMRTEGMRAFVKQRFDLSKVARQAAQAPHPPGPAHRNGNQKG